MTKKFKYQPKLLTKKQMFFINLNREIDCLIAEIPYIKDKRMHKVFEAYLDYKMVTLLLFLLNEELDARA